MLSHYDELHSAILTQAWIAADFGKPLTIARVRIAEPESFAGRIRRVEFQYRTDTGWETIFTGDRRTWDFQRSFNPVTAREFRLNVLEATNGPTISEIELFEP